MELKEEVEKPVKRSANVLNNDEIRNELNRYSIVPSGVAENNVAILQKKFDKEYELAMIEYDRKIDKRKKKILQHRKRTSLIEEIDEENLALSAYPKLKFALMQIESQATESDMVLDGVSITTCRSIMRSLENNMSLVSIDLSHNQLNDTSGEYIATMLKKNRRLEKIDLGFNNFGSRTLKGLSIALLDNDILVNLNLENNLLTTMGDNFDRSGIEAFATMLTKNRTLTSVNLFQTGLGIEVGKAISAAVIMNDTIIILDLGNNNIHFQELSSIANQLEENLSYFEDKKQRVLNSKKQALEKKKDREMRVHEQKIKDDQENWHRENAKIRKEKRDTEEKERARITAELEVKRLADIEEKEQERLKKIADHEAKLLKKKAKKKKRG